MLKILSGFHLDCYINIANFGDGKFFPICADYAIDKSILIVYRMWLNIRVWQRQWS